MSFDPDSDSSYSAKQDDSGCIAQFYYHPLLNGAKSLEAGREVFVDTPYVLILVKGQSKTEVRRKALDEDKVRFSQAWKAFQEGKETAITGTPLENMHGLMPSQIQELKSMYIRTVEDLAGMSDLATQKYGHGGVDLRKKAQAFIEHNNVEVMELKAQIASLKSTVNELTAKLDPKITDIQDALGKRGRPRKAAA